jgi:FtsP/CotA-like multicopper oxidase with cupredoxin domain
VLNVTCEEAGKMPESLAITLTLQTLPNENSFSRCKTMFKKFLILCVLGIMLYGGVGLNRQPRSFNASIAQAQDNPQRLDPLTIPKYVDPLVIPPVLAPVSETDGVPRYEIAVRQFQQQILPAGFPPTTVFGYGSLGDTSTFNSPAFTIETRTDHPLEVLWVNQLVDDPDSENPQYLPHILPIDQTLHWANPPGPSDMRGDPANHEFYTGPIPIVTHVHGAHVIHTSDGYPEAWYLPAASNIPEGYTTRGALYASAEDVGEGAALFTYQNDQRAATLWYHDHALGMTRNNVYAGMAGFYIIRDDVEDSLNLPGPGPQLGDAPDTRYYEIPIVVQDRIFNDDGSLFYPDSRAFFDEYEGPFMPEAPVSPIWNPEFFGDTMMVNGKTWPYLEVEPRLYRFRLLNGTNSRFLVLKFDKELPFTQIGTEGGLLPGAPIVLEQLLIAPAERADVIVDFSGFAPGDEILMLNLGPDEPFGGFPIDPEVIANPETTGQVMQFRVVELTDNGNRGEIPTSLPPIERLSTDLPSRDLTLNEELYDPADIPIGAKLGTSADGPLGWDADITEIMGEGDIEIWNIINLTVDAHPIHLHLVNFQVVERLSIRELQYEEAIEQYIMNGQQGNPPNILNYTDDVPRGPEAWETGWKDTVIAYPGEVTRIIAHFDLAGLYVWHCHILEHEDNEMMRPFLVKGTQ